MSDIYDQEVERLSRKTPAEIYEEWVMWRSPLFVSIHPSGGCVSQISCGKCLYYEEHLPTELVEALHALKLPDYGITTRREIPVSDLPKFAEGRRLVNKHLTPKG